MKTVRFKNPKYIGDPVNTVRIFNELEVDELCFVDIRASVEGRLPNFRILEQIANECFMPLSYGGGISDFKVAQRIFGIGFEKIVLNTVAYRNRKLVTQISEFFGSQAIIGSIDVKRNIFGKYHVFINDGTERVSIDPVEYAVILQNAGVGEILLTSIDNEGTWLGFDLEITKKVTDAVSIPIIANGGAGSLNHIGDVFDQSQVSAIGLGSMIVYQKQGMGVLVNFPDRNELNRRICI